MEKEIPKDAKRQPNAKCAKCKRDIKQEYNAKTLCFEYAETFRKKKIKNKINYYCNECYENICLG